MARSVQMLRLYLGRDELTIHTDQSTLHWLLNITEPSGWLARWRLRISELGYNIRYLKGIKRSLAD